MTFSDNVKRQAIAAASAEQQGRAFQFAAFSPPMPPGAGLIPIAPALVAQLRESAPSPAQLESVARAAIAGALGVVRVAGPLAAGVGGALAAFSPVAGGIGAAVSPYLNAVPYVGPALSAAAAVAGPVTGVAGTVLGVGGGLAAAATGQDPGAMLTVGRDVISQLDQLSSGIPTTTPAPPAGNGG